jgi:hypothetical protein
MRSHVPVLWLKRMSAITVLQEWVTETITANARPRCFALLHRVEATTRHVPRDI